MNVKKSKYLFIKKIRFKFCCERITSSFYEQNYSEPKRVNTSDNAGGFGIIIALGLGKADHHFYAEKTTASLGTMNKVELTYYKMLKLHL